MRAEVPGHPLALPHSQASVCGAARRGSGQGVPAKENRWPKIVITPLKTGIYDFIIILYPTFANRYNWNIENRQVESVC
jgi:hypothetical protein